MRKLILLFTYLYGMLAFSQTVVFEDHFDTDKNTFLVKKDKDYESYIKNGQYVIKSKTESSYWFYKYMDIDPEKENFTIEATVELLKGKPSVYYGLAIGMYNDQSNFVNFYLNNEGNFFISHYYSNEFHSLAPNQSSKAIHFTGKQVLKVVREYNVCSYYINGVLVHADAERSYYGSGLAMQIYGKGEVGFEDLKITKSIKDYNVVENAIIGRKKENLGSLINSKYSELAPLVAPDGKTLYFTRDEDPSNIGGSGQDIWYCTLDANGNWSPAKNIGRPLNNSGHNFLVNITPDNNRAYIGNTYTTTGDAEGSGVSISTRNTNGWTIPQSLVIKDFKNVDQYVDYHPVLSNNFIIISVDNEKTYGRKDLFVCFKKDDGTYDTPLNLGPVINSVGSEFGPVLAADQKTLYFNSYGHAAYGSADVFVSKRLDDSWTNWSKPQNLGPEVNSDVWDGQISLAADGKYGYMSTSDNVADGSTDIFRFELGSAKPEPVLLVYGRVLNSKTKEPISASINYNDLANNKNMGTAISNYADGSYKIILPIGKAYSFMAEKGGFYPISENIDVTNLTEYTEIERYLYLSPVEIGEVIRLNNIFFEYDKAELKSESEAELNRLIDFLVANPTVEIQLSGHTDNKGSDTYNLDLSQKRINSVVNYLVNKGIKKERLKGIGYGEGKPIATNETDEGRAKNRRVEFTILKK